MDFVFNCASCQGPLVVRSELRGRAIRCAHCSQPVDLRSGRAVTESVVDALLDVAPLEPRSILRRVRPATCQSSAGRSPARPRLVRGVRVVHAV